jgi:hypothetical protein
VTAGDPKEVPGPTPEWAEEYLRGATYQTIADRLGVSKQHVPNLLKKHGLPTRTAAETAKLRDERCVEEHGEAIRARFLQYRDVGAVATEFGMPDTRAQRVLETLVPDLGVLTKTPRQTAKRYTREELLASLVEAAEGADGILTAQKYKGYTSTHAFLADGRPRPGGQAMGLRFGSWNAALQAAGLPTNPHSGPAKRFEDPAVAIAALVACWHQLTAPPTVGAYDAWQRDYEGWPSPATARKLFGSWNLALVRAWQIVHGIELDQDDLDVVVPESIMGGVGSSPFGSIPATYRPADEDAAISPALTLSLDGYLLLERAVRAHARVQNAVANGLLACGVSPMSPHPDQPQFDVAFVAPDGVFTVVEVKSCTPENIELQLRLGLGQVLRYTHQLRHEHLHVRPVLATELPPSADWADLLDRLEVGLIREGELTSDLHRLLGLGGADPSAGTT